MVLAIRFFIGWRDVCCVVFLNDIHHYMAEFLTWFSWPRSQSRIILCAFCCAPFCNYVCIVCRNVFIINWTWQELHAKCKYSETVSEIKLLRHYFIKYGWLHLISDTDSVHSQSLTAESAFFRPNYACVLMQKKKRRTEGADGNTLGTKTMRLAKTRESKCFS